MARNYNFIYRKLVKDKDDLVGLVAYALYKNHKIEFIEDYRAKHNGEDPTDTDFEAFAFSSCAQSSLLAYKDEAEFLLQKLTLTAASEEISEFEKEMLRTYRAEIESAIKQNTPKWWWSVIYSVIGALIFSLFVALGSYLGQTSEKSNVELIKSTINAVLPSQE